MVLRDLGIYFSVIMLIVLGFFLQRRAWADNEGSDGGSAPSDGGSSSGQFTESQSECPRVVGHGSEMVAGSWRSKEGAKNQGCALHHARTPPWSGKERPMGPFQRGAGRGRGRKKAPPEAPELPEGVAEDFWMSGTTARLPSLDQLKQLLAKGGQAKECLAASEAVARQQGVEEILAASKDRWLQRLKMGFNLLFEGTGSKWRLLERFAQELRHLPVDVCCLDGFDAHASVPGFLRQLLAHGGQHRGVGSLEALVAAVLAARDTVLVLVVHNLEALPPQQQAALGWLATDPKVWLVASVDHLWAAVAWSSDMLKDFNFSREEVHTMEGYEIELKGKYPEHPPSWSDPFTVEVSSKVSMGLVLKSLTSNHRELVEVMAKNQLEGRKEGISMPDLLVVAEDRMIANNLTKLRRLLNELTDHDIVVQRQGHDGSTVYALVAKDPLLRRLAQGEMPCDGEADKDEDDDEAPSSIEWPELARAICAAWGGSGLGKGEVVVTLIAAGNSGHVCAALIDGNTQGRVKVQLLTSRPELFQSLRPKVRFPNGEMQEGLLYRVSRNPAELIPNSDIVLWTGPVTSTKEVFEKLQPYFDARRTCIGTIFAQGLVHVSAQRIFGPHVRFFALRNIPWLCRVVKAGEESAISGAKSAIGVMTCNLSEEWVKRELEPLFVVQKCGKREPTLELLPDFCPVVFNPANQIIHPARYWAMFRNWRGVPLSKEEEPPEWLYRDMDETAGQVLVVLDEELQALKDAYYQATGAEGCHHVIPLATRLLEQYGDQIADQSTMAKMVGTNKAYSMARTPVLRTMQGVMPHPNHRVVTDDIGWGLCVLVSIAERLQDFGVQTPTTMMRMLIEWHQKIMKKEYLYNGRLRGRDCAELVLLGPGDELSMVAKGVESESGGDWISKADGQASEPRYGNP
ncbi:Octopine dehydrogenase (OcDH) [Durusdinium trenchii]|uniref:Octopine dehydrogenase (OcDH) n=1 Tax=Durusdinium trenchii TaxID=1381693 RepID=A0ABP0NYT9_9DINO